MYTAHDSTKQLVVSLSLRQSQEKRFRDFGQKLSPQNQLDIYFLTLWEHWLGLAKPKNVFRSILHPSIIQL